MPELLATDSTWDGWDFAFFGYETSRLPRWNWPSWLPLKRRIPFDEHVRALVSRLEEISASSEEVPFIGLVGHSLGGLLILAAIRRIADEARTRSAYARVLSSIRFILLYGTPVQGSDRVPATLALLHPELRPLWRLEPERQELIRWLAQYVRRPLLCLPSGDGATAILTSVVYSPTDVWVGSREARGLAPAELEKSISVTHSGLCKPTSHDDVRYLSLVAARNRAEHLSDEVEEVLAAEDAFRALLLSIRGELKVLDLPTAVPRRVAELFQSLAATPQWADGANHYQKIAHYVRITRRGSVERRTTRAGFRVAPGAGRFIEMDVAGGVPLSSRDQDAWTVLDARAGTFLQLDVIDAPDAFRKLLRAQLATPLRQRDRFEIEFRWAWPEPEERNMDCIGFKFQQLAHGLEKAELIVDFEIAPWDVRFFKLKGSTVTEEQPSFQLLSSPDKSMACRYQLDLHEPTNEQWLMVWFAELKSEADTI